MELESIRAYDAREHLAFNGRRIKEKAFRSLSGLLRGICVDGVVNQEEQTELWEWIRENAHYAKYHPWDLVINHLEDYLRDGKGVSGFLCLGRLFQGQPNEAALCI